MARYFAGNSLGAFFRSSLSVSEITSGGTFNSAYARNCIQGGAAIDFFSTKAPFLNGGSSISGTMYLRFDWLMQNNQCEILMLSGGVNAYRITSGGSGTVQVQYWNTVSGAWVAWVTSFAFNPGTVSTAMFKLTMQTGWTMTLSGTTIASSAVVPTNAQASIDEIRFFGSLAKFSEIMCADYDIRDAHLMDVVLSGNSAANTGGTGTFSDVAEIVLNEATAENVATVGNKMGQTHTAVTVPVALGIAAVILNGRGRVSGGVITDGKLGIRSGGSNFSSPGLAYNGGYEPRGYMVQSDPATGLAWTQTSFNAAETYIEAA